MGNQVADSKTPALVAFVMVVTGIALAAMQGLTHGSIAGGVIAAAGCDSRVLGMWKGIQQETGHSRQRRTVLAALLRSVAS